MEYTNQYFVNTSKHTVFKVKFTPAHPSKNEGWHESHLYRVVKKGDRYGWFIFKKTAVEDLYKDGFWDGCGSFESDELYTADELLKKYHDYYIEDGIVYCKPRVTIIFLNDRMEHKYFTTDKEAFDFYNELVEKLK